MLTDILRRRVRGHEIAAPELPAGIVPVLSTRPERVPRGVYNMIGQTFIIEYVDGYGEFSRRRITLRGIRPVRSDYWYSAYCHEACEPRSFYQSRIRSFISVETGEVFEDRHRFLGSLSWDDDDDEPAALVARALHGLKTPLVLMVRLARCDGLHRSEEDVLYDYVLDAHRDYQHLPEDEVRAQLRRLHPDDKLFGKAMRSTRFLPADEWRSIARTLRRMVDADGVITNEEFEFVTALEEGARRLPS
ncbi:MAG: hypothetical protein AB7R90_19320 [Reyranellaceae bacterium]